MDYLLKRALAHVVTHGSLAVRLSSGARCVFGDGTGELVEARFVDRRAQWAFLIDPDMKLGELFTDGRLVIERGTMFDFLMLVVGNQNQGPPALIPDLLDRLRVAMRRLLKRNFPSRSRRNVAHHYDLDGRLYDLFLDSDRQYSCAYFETPGQSLEQAQLAKKRRIAAKLLVNPGASVLDIGCGWGGLALYLAEIAEAGPVTGVTLSKEQIDVARQRATERGVADRVVFAFQDYRAVTGTFDRIVSVGMFEHVGVGFYRDFFDTVARLLAKDGVMLLHTIGCSDAPGFTTPWIDKYIFPGGDIPALSEVVAMAERSGLMVTDIEILRLHYASTLRIWRERFMARRDEAVRIYDERFCRMWEFYLASAEMAFHLEGLVVFQLQIAKRVEAVPTTRDYIAQRESELRAREQRHATGLSQHDPGTRSA
ncbi:MAG: class I SAM-dependent methyltransferase [Proteobacteria bacterium]|nr:class I SAM-dependent methyltransferase [Pseudomonadota bacterium]